MGKTSGAGLGTWEACAGRVSVSEGIRSVVHLHTFHIPGAARTWIAAGAGRAGSMNTIADYAPSRARRGARARTALTTGAAMPTATGGASGYGEYRAKRLRKAQPTSAKAWVIDLLWSIAVPASLGVAIAAIAMGLLEVDDVDDWVRNTPISSQVVTSLSTLVALIVSLRLSQNLTENATSIEAFNDVCGSVINIAVWSRSLVSKGEFTYVTLPNGTGGTYSTTRFALILASMPYVVKFTFRGRLDIPFEELPIGGDAKLLARAHELTASTDGLATVSPFTALLMMIGKRATEPPTLNRCSNPTPAPCAGEYIHQLEVKGEIKPSELGTLFKQIDSLVRVRVRVS